MPTQEGIGRATKIVNILNEYPTSIPVGFLASRLSTSVADLDIDLKELESKNVIRREKDYVLLVRKRSHG